MNDPELAMRIANEILEQGMGKVLDREVEHLAREYLALATPSEGKRLLLQAHNARSKARLEREQSIARWTHTAGDCPL